MLSKLPSLDDFRIKNIIINAVDEYTLKNMILQWYENLISNFELIERPTDENTMSDLCD